MPPSPSHEVTRLLLDWSKGDRAALDQLMPVVYRELHKIATAYLRANDRDILSNQRRLLTKPTCV